MESYDKVLKGIRDYKLDSDSTDELKERIINSLDSIRESRTHVTLSDLLFGWTDIVWLRRSLVISSLAIVLLFVTQQFSVFDRLESLEKRMIGISTENILEYQKENMHANSVMYSMSEDIFVSDSVRVSSKDLSSLIKSYRDLQEKYDELRKVISSNNPEIADNNNSKLKL